jgi:hypothetical protein
MLALITAASIPSIVSAFRTSADSFARETSLLLGQARDRAMLTDKLIRLRVDIDHQQMLLEEAPSTYMVRKPPEKPPSEREKEELEKKETETFVPVQDLMKEPRKMPYNLKIIEVRSPRFKRPITEGTADIFFFNNGNADGATIYFETDEKVHHSISIHPITGLTKLEAKAPPEGR